MADKTFDKQPMLTVVSDNLDPRVKRQLQAQLQSTMMSVSELTAEIERQDAIKNIKAQKDAVGDKSEFEDENTKNHQEPEAIENVDDNKGNADEPPKEEPKQEPKEEPKQEPAKEEPKPDQKQDGDQKQEEQPKEKPEQGNDQQGDDDKGGDDPFSDDVTFESFDSIMSKSIKDLRSKPKMESQTDDSDLPPIKNILYVPCSDRGVDNRTSAVVATIEDPENTVIILDQNSVIEPEAKMEFKSLTKQLQTRGIMVVESVDLAIEYLNAVHDELSA